MLRTDLIKWSYRKSSHSQLSKFVPTRQIKSCDPGALTSISKKNRQGKKPEKKPADKLNFKGSREVKVCVVNT